MPGGSGTSIASAYGTGSRSASAPPHQPPAAPKPYMDIGGTLPQSPCHPVEHGPQPPQPIWNGTTTRSPGRADRTSAPTATTSATHSWPSCSGSGSGVRPSTSGRSMSQVAMAIGRTVAASGPGGGGAGRSRQRNRPPGSAHSDRLRGPPRPATRSPASAVTRRSRAPVSRSSASRPACAPVGPTSAA